MIAIAEVRTDSNPAFPTYSHPNHPFCDTGDSFVPPGLEPPRSSILVSAQEDFALVKLADSMNRDVFPFGRFGTRSCGQFFYRYSAD